MISFSLWSRLACSFIAPKSGLGVCKYARFNFWISAISRLSTSTRCRMPPSIKVVYIFVQVGSMSNIPDFGQSGTMSTMSDIPEEKWIELYTSAMLELKHSLMAGRILEARTEIAARIEKLRGMPGHHERELQALADALHNLRTLERIEQQSDGEQQREAARTALEKVQTLAPRIERLKSGDDAT